MSWNGTSSCLATTHSGLPLLPVRMLRVVPYEATSGWSSKASDGASDGVERRRGRGLNARGGRRDAPAKNAPPAHLPDRGLHLPGLRVRPGQLRRPRAPARSVPPLDDDDAMAEAHQLPRRREPGEPGADDDARSLRRTGRQVVRREPDAEVDVPARG
eukprot:31197-Pelagococcus_subviridis.AAC.47